MNQFDIPGDDDLRFDRLVDGELSDAERRRLLASLDDEPGGWRCCALAFLEAQAWRETMRVVPQHGDAAGADTWQEPSESQLCKPAKPGLHSGSSEDGRDDAASDRPGLVRLALAMAVCFLVAFFLGNEFRRRLAPDAEPPSPLAQLILRTFLGSDVNRHLLSTTNQLERRFLALRLANGFDQVLNRGDRGIAVFQQNVVILNPRLFCWAVGDHLLHNQTIINPQMRL